MAKTVTTSGLRLTPDAALELMAHHLMMAAVLFEIVPNDHEGNIAEVERLFTDADQLDWIEPALLFVTSLNAYYEGLKADD